jgi:hypothetical protein
MSWLDEYLMDKRNVIYQRLPSNDESRRENLLREHSERNTSGLPEVVLDPDEVVRRRDEDDSIRALYCRFDNGGEELGPEVVEPLIRFALWASTVEADEIL